MWHTFVQLNYSISLCTALYFRDLLSLFPSRKVLDAHWQVMHAVVLRPCHGSGDESS